jgi:hypothetical protein
MQKEMKLVKMTSKEKEKIPTGFRKVFVKNIMGTQVKDLLTIESTKYNKMVLEAYRPHQPISKLF